VLKTAQVISTFSWAKRTENPGIAAAAEMLNNIVGMLLVIGANTIARKASNVSLY
jgi:putative aldouronate transport system permease protein